MTRASTISLLLVPLLLAGCGDGEQDAGEGETPNLLRTRFVSEMKTILRDVQHAEEQAAAIEGHYLELEALRARYLSRPVASTYRLVVEEVSQSGYRASVEHGPTGLRCRLEVGAGGGRGIPRCD